MRTKTSILILLLVPLAAAAASSGPEAFITPHRSMRVNGVTPDILHALEESDITVEWAHGDKATVYVSAEQERLLGYLGLAPVRVPVPEPLVPYPSLEDIYDSIDQILAAHQDICRGVTIGTSVQGRPIRAVVVSANPGVEEVEPELRIHGGIHGDEMTSAMVTRHYLDVLTDGYATSPVCQYLVDGAETWIIPVLNPDGYVADQRYNANGVDLNRNLSYMGYPDPFSEPETRALRDITMQSWPAVENFVNPFCVGLSLHGGAECFNSPWNYTESPLPEDVDLMYVQGDNYAGNPGIVSYFGSFTIYVPGATWYETNGDVNDWSYGECGTVDQTIEVHNDKHASDWPGVSEAHYGAILQFFQEGTYGIWGTVVDGSGNPLDAEIGIGSSSDSEPLRFCRTDVTMGDYHKTLLPGTYDVQATADGYGSGTVTGVTVGSGERVEVSFVLDPVGIEEGHGTVPGPAGISVGPNPAMRSCTIAIGGGLGGELAIYDITGRTVHRETVPAGTSSVSWSCEDGSGARVPSGIYLVRLSSGSQDHTARLTVGSI